MIEGKLILHVGLDANLNPIVTKRLVEEEWTELSDEDNALYWEAVYDLFHRETGEEGTGVEWTGDEYAFRVDSMVDLGTPPTLDEVEDILTRFDICLAKDNPDDEILSEAGVAFCYMVPMVPEED